MHRRTTCVFFFFFNDTATTEIYTLSLHDALPICLAAHGPAAARAADRRAPPGRARADLQHAAGPCRPARPDCSRSEEHTSELQSPCNLVCRLLLEKKIHTTPVRSRAPARTTPHVS